MKIADLVRETVIHKYQNWRTICGSNIRLMPTPSSIDGWLPENMAMLDFVGFGVELKFDLQISFNLVFLMTTPLCLPQGSLLNISKTWDCLSYQTNLRGVFSL